MDYVYIDAQVFINENILAGNKIRELFRLANEGYVKLVITRITYNEVLNRIKKNTLESLNTFRSFRDKMKILRNIPEMVPRFEPPDETVTIENIQRTFINTISEAGTVIIEYPVLNIEEVFEKYFKSSSPFNATEKKNEFPDAFSLVMLEQWAVFSKVKCIVVSGDKDLTNYNSGHLKIYSSLADYLDLILRKIAEQSRRKHRIEIASKLFDAKKFRLERDLKGWLEKTLKDERTYKAHWYGEIDEIEIETASVEIGDFQIMSIATDKIILSADATLNVEVDLTVQKEWSHRDQWENDFFDDNSEIISTQKVIQVSFQVEFPLAGDQFSTIDLLDINNGQDLHL